MARKPTKLTEAQKAFLVQRLACWDTPSEAAAAINEEYGLSVSPQGAEKYDPTKRAGLQLSKHLVQLFNATRKAFVENLEAHIPEANKAVRVRQLAHASRAFKDRGNYVAMADMLERIAKEVGNVHSNRREVTGAGGGPVRVDYADMTDDELDRRLGQLMRGKALAEGGET